MSFEEQERALLDLLFNERLRQRFVAEGPGALVKYELSDQERADFAHVNRFGLETDARLRRDLMLQRLCRAFPVMFSIASALPGGLDRARALVDAEHVRAPAVERSARYGQALAAELAKLPYPGRERAPVMAICEGEVGLAWAAAKLRARALEGQDVRVKPARLPMGWQTRALTVAPFVCLAVLPRSYAELKRALCPCALDVLYTRLCTAQLPLPRLTDALLPERPKLLVGRAVAERVSRCEADVTYQYVELSDGFGPMLGSVDGRNSTDVLLALLARAGAEPPLIAAVRDGFAQLVKHGMLTLAE